MLHTGHMKEDVVFYILDNGAAQVGPVNSVRAMRERCTLKVRSKGHQMLTALPDTDILHPPVLQHCQGDGERARKVTLNKCLGVPWEKFYRHYINIMSLSL